MHCNILVLHSIFSLHIHKTENALTTVFCFYFKNENDGIVCLKYVSLCLVIFIPTLHSISFHIYITEKLSTVFSFCLKMTMKRKCFGVCYAPNYVYSSQHCKPFFFIFITEKSLSTMLLSLSLKKEDANMLLIFTQLYLFNHGNIFSSFYTTENSPTCTFF